MLRKINRPHALTAMSFMVFLCVAATANAQDAMFVDSAGNVGVGTNAPASPLHVIRPDGTAAVRVEDTGTTNPITMFELVNNGGHAKFVLRDDSQSDVNWEFRTAGTEGLSERFQISKIGSGVIEASFDAGGDLEIGGTLAEGSSRAIKRGIVPVDDAVVLAKLRSLEISEWSYKADSRDRHVGPMAEDFYSTFGLGPDNKHIAPRDLAGVGLAATKALNEKVEALQAENDQLRHRLEALEARMKPVTDTSQPGNGAGEG